MAAVSIIPQAKILPIYQSPTKMNWFNDHFYHDWISERYLINLTEPAFPEISVFHASANGILCHYIDYLVFQSRTRSDFFTGRPSNWLGIFYTRLHKVNPWCPEFNWDNLQINVHFESLFGTEMRIFLRGMQWHVYCKWPTANTTDGMAT